MQKNNEEYTARMEELYKKIVPLNEYKEEFVRECKKESNVVSTGILGIDKLLNGGFSNELIIMSAESSAGKSALMFSLANNVAAQGIDVLYFSLEMSKKELAARGVSCASYEKAMKDETIFPVAISQVLSWTYDPFEGFTKLAYEMYRDFVDEYYSRCGGHMHIIEAGIEGLATKDIANLAAMFKTRTGKTPIVFVDYLQLLKADPNDRAQIDRKTKLDVAVATLKTLASQIGLPVFALSSIARSGYGQKVGMASFKESGEIEYTAGILFGLNWTGVTDARSEEDASTEIQASDQRGYRKMKLEILKYRNGARYKSVNLNYYSAYNYFEEAQSGLTRS
ncbi:MAG: hypothetical protein LUH58_00835 [Lachnospiraceae bacterium]|nr:hypothetical protein [Lachnospiraceae bacterium]